MARKPKKQGSSAGSKTIEQLAEEQGINPRTQLADIMAAWPKWLDSDELLKFILADRRKRRNGVNGETGDERRSAGHNSGKPAQSRKKGKAR